MPSPSYTYTLTNGTTADASQVMQNFNDIKNGVTDGTKDLSISALTCAGTATFNGSVNLGNASGDDLTVTGSLASTIPIKTTASYDIGSSTLGLRALYFGRNSQTVNIQGSSSMSATWTLTLPVTAGTAGYGLQTDGNGVTSWRPMHSDIHSVSSADYTVLDTDGYYTIEVTTGASNRTITLPTAADNTDRRIVVKKVDSGAGIVIVDGESSETIDGATTHSLYRQYDFVMLHCNGTSWDIIGRQVKNVYQRKTLTTTVSAATDPVAALTFSNLVSGRTYRLSYSATMRVSGTSASEILSLEAEHNGSVLATVRARADAVTDTHDFTGAAVVTFVAAATTVTFDFDLNGTGSLLGTDSGLVPTFAELIELNDVDVTTAW